MLHLFDAQTSGKISLKLQNRFPQIHHLIGWFNLLLDSHVVDFIKQPRCQALVESLWIAVSTQMQTCEVEQSLYGFLSQLIQSRKGGAFQKAQQQADSICW